MRCHCAQSTVPLISRLRQKHTDHASTPTARRFSAEPLREQPLDEGDLRFSENARAYVQV